MDRNLGAMDIYYHGDSHYGDLYYQFGRKDPFSGPRKIYIRQDNEGNYSYVSWSTSTYTIQNTAADANCNNVPYSIHHPLMFIKGTYSSWTRNDIYNPTAYNPDIRWQDPYVTSDSGKSMFDPCPLGWKVPKNGTWTGFNTSNFLLNNPLSVGRNDLNSSAFYPASGNVYSGSGTFYDVGSNGHYWSCSPLSATNGFYLDFSSGYVYPSNIYAHRAYGFPVRCVQE